MKKDNCCEKMKKQKIKGGESMEISKKTMLWIVIGVLLVAAIFLTFKVSSLNSGSSNNGEIDTSGWTQNEIMNYQMHGVVPARVSEGSTQASSSSGMVGGC